MEIKCIFDSNVWVICICAIVLACKICGTVEHVVTVLAQSKYFEKEEVETDDEEEV